MWLWGWLPKWRKQRDFLDEFTAYRLEREFAEALIATASREVGKGERFKNNDGPDVKRYRGAKGGKGAWCAAFVSYCIEVASKKLGIPVPLKRSHGARQLFRWALNGTRPLQKPEKGMLVFWNRGVAGSWKGHIGIVCDVKPNGTFWAIEGNRGRYPAKVDIFRHQLGEDRLVGFARIKRA